MLAMAWVRAGSKAGVWRLGVSPWRSLCASSTSGSTTSAESASARCDGERESSEARESEGSVDRKEAAFFASLSGEWWRKEGGPMAMLHRMQPARIAFVRDAILAGTRARHGGEGEGGGGAAWEVLRGVRVLDVGCGGGLATENLARLGAHVTGLDASEANVAAARARLARGPLSLRTAEAGEGPAGRVEYVGEALEAHLAGGREGAYDAAVSLEVVEHVASAERFVRDLCRAVRPGGVAVVSTLNRSNAAFVGGVLLAERVLGYAAPGTHDWTKFLTPEELADMLSAEGMVVERASGLTLNPVAGTFAPSDDMSINYIVAARKPQIEPLHTP